MTFTVPLKDQTVMEHNEATFTCEISKPGRKVTWYRGDQEIKPDKKHQMTSSGVKHTLKVKDCLMDDNVPITAKIDEAETTAKLIVEGVFYYMDQAPVCVKSV